MAENGHLTYRTDEEVIQALYETGGNVKQTTKMLGLKDVTSLRQRINADPELRKAMIESREQLKDDAENVIAKTIRGKNKQQAVDAAKWYLPRKAKDRGYADVTRNENVNLNIDAMKAMVERAKRIPIEERKKYLEYMDADATDVE